MEKINELFMVFGEQPRGRIDLKPYLGSLSKQEIYEKLIDYSQKSKGSFHYILDALLLDIKKSFYDFFGDYSCELVFNFYYLGQSLVVEDLVFGFWFSFSLGKFEPFRILSAGRWGFLFTEGFLFRGLFFYT